MKPRRIFRKDRRRDECAKPDRVLEVSAVDSFVAHLRVRLGLSEFRARWKLRNLEERGRIHLRGYEEFYDWEDDPLAIWLPDPIDSEADQAQEEAGQHTGADRQLSLALAAPAG